MNDLIDYEDASPEVREVYDDIIAKRKIDEVNEFWKALAVQPEFYGAPGAGSKGSWHPVSSTPSPGR